MAKANSAPSAWCYTLSVRRFGLAIVVALLMFSASGVSGLAIVEPCTGYEDLADDDGGCPPTCVTCGCCAQAAEPAILPMTGGPELPVTDFNPPVPGLPRNNARDILHVPKPRVS
jgi:hypothetical protein